MAASRGQRGSGGSREPIFSITEVGKIMKKVLPSNARISTEAKETVEQCLTKFVASVTSEAAQRCNRKQRSELTGDDIIWGLLTVGFSEDHVRSLYNYLEKYRKLDQANEPEPEPEESASAIPVRLRHQISDRDYENGILGVGTAEDFQDLPALILLKIY